MFDWLIVVRDQSRRDETSTPLVCTYICTATNHISGHGSSLPLGFLHLVKTSVHNKSLCRTIVNLYHENKRTGKSGGRRARTCKTRPAATPTDSSTRNTKTEAARRGQAPPIFSSKPAAPPFFLSKPAAPLFRLSKPNAPLVCSSKTES